MVKTYAVALDIIIFLSPSSQIQDP